MGRTVGSESVREADGTYTTKNSLNLPDAKEYSDDCASETEDGPVYAVVLNQEGKGIYLGRHYGI